MINVLPPTRCRKSAPHGPHLFEFGNHYRYCFGKRDLGGWLAVVPPEVPAGE